MKIVSRIIFVLFILLGAMNPATVRGQVKNSAEDRDNPAIIRARQQWFLARRSINGSMPMDHYMNVRKQVSNYERLQKAGQSQAANWTSLGPTAITNTGVHNYSGRIIAIDVSPFDSIVVLIGAAGGGVWKSINGGTTWSPKSDDLGSLAVSCFARHPSDPNIIYAGTGEPSNNAGGINGIGIIKSTDGGETWFPLSLLSTALTHISAITVNTGNPNIVVAGNYFNGTDPNVNGIYRSTDAGNTWLPTNVVGTTFRPMSIIQHPTNSNILYALMARLSDLQANNNNGIWRSTNAGATWDSLALGQNHGLPDLANLAGKSVLIVCKQYPNFMCAIFSNRSDGSLLGCYKSHNGGVTWVNANLPDVSSASNAGGSGFFNGQGWYDIYVAVHPTDTNKIYVGGIDVIKTTNGGTTWPTNISDGYGVRNFHPDQQAFAFNPLNPNTIYLAGDGGIVKSKNGGSNILDLNHGLQITQFVGLSVALTDTNTVLGGSQDNGTELYNGSSTDWTFAFDGDGGFTEIDPTNKNIMYTENYHQSTGSDPFKQQRSTDGGSNWTTIISGLTSSDRSEFYVPYTLDENNPATLYLGSFRVYRSTNSGSNWTPVSGDLSGGAGETIVTIRVSRTNSNFVITGASAGVISISTNAGSTWSAISTSVLPARPVGDLVFRQYNENTIYAAFQLFSSLGGGDNKGHVWKTNNRGLNWINITGNLPDIPANALALDPNDTLHILVGTDVGIFRTTDGGSSWAPFNGQFPGGAVVTNLVTHFSTGLVYASTYGRGAFKNAVFKPAFYTFLSPSSPAEGQSVTVSAIIQGTTPVVKLFYAKDTQSQPDSIDMVFNVTQFTAQIPAAAVTSNGVWYRIRVNDQGLITYFPSQTGKVSVPVSISNGTIATVTTNGAFPGGIPSKTWNTIALPFNTSLNLTTLLGVQTFNSQGKPTNWAAFSVTNEVPSSVTTLTNGTGYVIQQASATSKAITITSPTTNDVNILSTFVLTPGWNLVPWPFTYGADVTVTNSSAIGSIWQLAGSSWVTTTHVKPFGGYAINNKTVSNVNLTSVISWTSTVPKQAAQSLSNMIRFKADAGAFQDYYNYAGVADESTEKADVRDEAEPMGFGEHLELYFPNADNGRSYKFSTDMRSSQSEGNTWDMVVNNSTKENFITLSWEKMNLPSDYKVTLVDITHNRFIDADAVTGYSFKSEKINTFKVIMGKSGYVGQESQKLSASLPKVFALKQNYPNPFNPSTTIAFDLAGSGNMKLKIYNVLGQEIRTIANGFYLTGHYTIAWDGKDATGKSVASGIYFYRLETENFTKSRKMLLVK